jgi:hypothetical protein
MAPINVGFAQDMHIEPFTQLILLLFAYHFNFQ